MRILTIYSLLLMSTFLSTLSRANCVIGNGEILEAGESTAIVDVEQLNTLAKSLYSIIVCRTKRAMVQPSFKRV